MKCPLALLVSTALITAGAPAWADAYDCFPVCAALGSEARESKLNLCDNALVREGARLDAELAPVKEVYGIVTNPTGFVLKQVSEHVVPLPKWLPYAIDPKGAVQAAVLKKARKEARKQLGLQDDCRVEISTADAADVREDE